MVNEKKVAFPVIVQLETFIPEGDGAGGDYHRQAQGHVSRTLVIIVLVRVVRS